MGNKLTTLNRFVVDTSLCNITHSAVITRIRNIKINILKRGGKWKRAKKLKPSQTGFLKCDGRLFCTEGL